MEAPTKTVRPEDVFVRAYEQHEGSRLNGSSQRLGEVRREAIERFSTLGIPQKDERWKYTNISRVLRHEYAVELEPTDAGVTAADLEPLWIPELEAHRLVLVNGRYRADLSDVGDLPEGVIVKPFAQAIEEHTDLVDQHFSKYAEFEDESFIALNTAFTKDGVFVYVPANVQFERPVHVLHVISTDRDLFVQPRNLFIAGRSSSVKIVESTHTLTATKTFTNAVTEVFVDANAHVDHYKIQRDGDNASQVNSVDIFQGADSTFSTDTITLSGDVVRNNLHIVHGGENIHSHLYGLFLGRGTMHVDNHTLVDHAQPHCVSDELFKGVLDDQSTGVFNGKVFVHRDAQQTNAYQQNGTILLTEDANMYSKPELEIYADDVQCSHGATTGQLDEEGLFYLRSRGLSKQRARAIMLLAFARDVIDAIAIDAVRDHLDGLVTERFQQTVS